MLQVDLRDVRRGPVSTEGRLAPEDPAFEGLDVVLLGPVLVAGLVQATSEDEYLWRGQIQARIGGECRRCLRPLDQELVVEPGVLFSADPEALDDPSVYPLAAGATHLDLAPVVREELALAVPAFPLCRDDCAGLCPGCGADLNAGPCACTGTAEPV